VGRTKPPALNFACWVLGSSREPARSTRWIQGRTKSTERQWHARSAPHLRERAPGGRRVDQALAEYLGHADPGSPFEPIPPDALQQGACPGGSRSGLRHRNTARRRSESTPERTVILWNPEPLPTSAEKAASSTCGDRPAPALLTVVVRVAEQALPIVRGPAPPTATVGWRARTLGTPHQNDAPHRVSSRRRKRPRSNKSSNVKNSYRPRVDAFFASSRMRPSASSADLLPTTTNPFGL
jgi:hypothetical protein